MTWQGYLAFLGIATLVVLIPGQDFAVVTRASLVGGLRRSAATSLGITTSNALQGTAAATGLGALVVGSHTAFTAIRWAGVAYLVYLGVTSLWRARRHGLAELAADDQAGRGASFWTGWRQGFLSNITNPKVLVFYLSLVPQFMPSQPRTVDLLLLALTHAVISLGYLLLLGWGMARLRRVLTRPRVRRALEAVTGTVLLGLAGRVATTTP